MTPGWRLNELPVIEIENRINQRNQRERVIVAEEVRL
jgi:hypothetical protein